MESTRLLRAAPTKVPQPAQRETTISGFPGDGMRMNGIKACFLDIEFSEV